MASILNFCAFVYIHDTIIWYNIYRCCKCFFLWAGFVTTTTVVIVLPDWWNDKLAEFTVGILGLQTASTHRSKTSESSGAAYWGEGTHFNFGCSSQKRVQNSWSASGCLKRYTNQVQWRDSLCFLLHILIACDRRSFSKNQIESLHAIFAIPRDIFWPQPDSSVAHHIVHTTG